MKNLEDYIKELVQTAVKEALSTQDVDKHDGFDDVNVNTICFQGKAPLVQDILSTYSYTEPRTVYESYRQRPERSTCGRTCWYNHTQYLVRSGRLAKVYVGGRPMIVRVKEDNR